MDNKVITQLRRALKTLPKRLVPYTIDLLRRVRDYHLVRNFLDGLQLMLADRTTRFYFTILMVILMLGIVGPYLAPFGINETQYHDDGSIMRAEAPSLDHPLGTTFAGNDVLSRILVGARPTVITGLLGGAIIISIGASIGITAGYKGGWVEDALMRFTDFVYGVPLIPFAIVMITFFGIGFIQSIVVIGIVLWRGSARVLRAQTLSVKQHVYVQVAKASGASDTHIILKHILPNVAPLAVFFLAIGIGFAIMLQASLTFLGVSDPFVPSWGVMIRNAFDSGYMSSAWWWSITPGLMIGITVLSTYMFGRGYEDLLKGTEGEQLEADAMTG